MGDKWEIERKISRPKRHKKLELALMQFASQVLSYEYEIYNRNNKTCIMIFLLSLSTVYRRKLY